MRGCTLLESELRLAQLPGSGLGALTSAADEAAVLDAGRAFTLGHLFCPSKPHPEQGGCKGATCRRYMGTCRESSYKSA